MARERGRLANPVSVGRTVLPNRRHTDAIASETHWEGPFPPSPPVGEGGKAALKPRPPGGGDDGFFSVISRAPAIDGGTLYSAGGEMLWSFGPMATGWAAPPRSSAG